MLSRFAARAALVGGTLCICAGAWACLNDRDSDSLAVEGGKLPNVVAVITGRFERNPPLFYQMRRARVAHELQTRPNDLKLYDDVAVACDRLGNDDEALIWIAKKRAVLNGLPKSDAHLSDAWYRYYANVGTFRVHRWLHEGAKYERRAELMQARAEIAQALVLNPNAHFGRERYQLATMDWLLTRDKSGRIPDFLSRYILKNEKGRSDEAVEGLSGLIVLGAAWESTDVFGALGASLQRMKSGKLNYLASLRIRELFGNSKASLSGNPVSSNDQERFAYQLTSYWRGTTNENSTAAKYRELRAEAEAWNKARTDFMLTRLKAGRHPDTVPGFWKGYAPAPAPSLDVPWRSEWRENLNNATMKYFPAWFLLFVLTMPLFLWGLYAGVRRFMRREAGQQDRAVNPSFMD